MSNLGSKVMWIGGGTGLFAAAFLGVALARGAVLREVPPISWFAGAASTDEHAPGSATAPAPTTTAEHAPAPEKAKEPRAAVRSAPIVPPMTAGVLGAFVMPSPYDARELNELSRSLKEGLARVAAEEERQKRRERELDDWQSVLQQRAQELTALRQSLEESSGPGSNDKGASNKAAIDKGSAASWRALAPMFEEGEPSEVAERLALLDPDQAAQVLRGLDSDRCAAILNALPKDRYKTFLDAWRRAGG